MKFAHISSISCRMAIVFAFAAVSAKGQVPNEALAKQVNQFAASGDYASIGKLVDAHESAWKTAPSTAYFNEMGTIAFVLLEQSHDQMYWLGRKVLWDVLTKPAPREVFAARSVYTEKEDLLRVGAEGFGRYEFNASPEMFASIRHDTFLMLSEYARLLHAEMIPGYKKKPRGAMNDDIRPFLQNIIDNEVQEQDRKEIQFLAEDQTRFLILFYRRKPRDDQELKELLDILNIQGATRDAILKQVVQGMYFPPGFPPELRKRFEE